MNLADLAKSVKWQLTNLAKFAKRFAKCHLPDLAKFAKCHLADLADLDRAFFSLFVSVFLDLLMQKPNQMHFRSIQIRFRVRIRVRIRICVWIRIRICIRIQVQIQILMRIRVRIRIWIPVRIRIPVRVPENFSSNKNTDSHGQLWCFSFGWLEQEP